MSIVDSDCTTGPCTSTDVGSMELIYDSKDLCIVNFKPINENVICVSNEVMVDLSTDQLYLLKACLAVQQGFTSSTHIPLLPTAMTGNLINSRRLTKANRILHLYISKQDFSKQLYKIT